MQLTIEFPPVPFSVGDRLLFVKNEHGFFFINEIGFKTFPLPEEATISTEEFGMCVNAITMPSTTSRVRYHNGTPCMYYADCHGKIYTDESMLLKLFNGDTLTVLALPSGSTG